VATRTNKNLNQDQQIITGTKMKLTELKIKNAKPQEKA
jgi:hypothetical protein